MTHYYVVLDADGEDNLVIKPTEKTVSLEMFAQQGAFPAWNIVGEGYIEFEVGTYFESGFSCTNR